MRMIERTCCLVVFLKSERGYAMLLNSVSWIKVMVGDRSDDLFWALTLHQKHFASIPSHFIGRGLGDDNALARHHAEYCPGPRGARSAGAADFAGLRVNGDDRPGRMSRMRTDEVGGASATCTPWP